MVSKPFEDLWPEMKEAASLQPERIKEREEKRRRREERVKEEEKAESKPQPEIDAMDVDAPQIPPTVEVKQEAEVKQEGEVKHVDAMVKEEGVEIKKDVKEFEDEESDMYDIDPVWADPKYLVKLKKSAPIHFKRIRYVIRHSYICRLFHSPFIQPSRIPK